MLAPQPGAQSSCIASAIGTSKYLQVPKKAISFIRAGEKPTAHPQTTTGLLYSAPDWQLEVNRGKQLRFTQHIAITSFRPDMIITSEDSKHLTMLELTVAWKEQIEEVNEKKRSKYQELVEEFRVRGWRTFYEPTKVGYRESVLQSLYKALSQLGVAKKSVTTSANKTAEKATEWLWIKRDDPWIVAGTQVGA